LTASQLDGSAAIALPVAAKSVAASKLRVLNLISIEIYLFSYDENK
jgi:hypothetical protein